MIGEILVFLATYVLILARPWKLNEATAALIGAIVMAVLFLQPHNILEALGFSTPYGTPLVTTWNVVLILIELMVISTFLDDYGFFEFCAVKAMHLAGGDTRRLFAYTYAVTCLITAFTSNDIAILTLTPIVLKFCRRAGLDARPFMYSFFFAANIASMFLYIGNLTNILIGDAFKLGYFDFTAYMFLPTMAAIVVNYVIFYFMFRDSLEASYPVAIVNAAALIKNPAMVIAGLVVLAFVLIGCGFANRLLLPLSVVTTLGAGAIYLVERKPIARTKRISWRVVVFVLSLFIVVEGLKVGGATAMIGGLLLPIVGQNPVYATFFISMASAFLCNVVNNIPMTAMMVPVTSGIVATPKMALAMAYSLVIGSNLGANITITGALAGILWLECARVEKWSTGITDFIKTGLTVTPLVILASSAVLALELVLF